MPKYKVIFHRDKCIGCGACTAQCPENWSLDKEGKAKPKKLELTSLSCNKEAEKVCPVDAIEIKEVH